MAWARLQRPSEGALGVSILIHFGRAARLRQVLRSDQREGTGPGLAVVPQGEAARWPKASASRSLRADERKVIGDDIRTTQFGWPVGMPLVRKLDTGLWEVRVTLASGIARVFFTMVENEAILLHGFIKKSQKTPLTELETAKKRKRELGTS